MSQKCVLIIANGKFDLKLVKKYITNHTIVALDGALINLLKNNIIPHYVIGDFDSLKTQVTKVIGNPKFNKSKYIFQSICLSMQYFESLKKPKKLIFEKYPVASFTLIRAVCQDYTDLDKGIEFALQENAKSIKIICALEGHRIDHFLHNISILKQFYNTRLNLQKHSVPIHIETGNQIIKYMQSPDHESFRGAIGSNLAIFGFPTCYVKTKGLEWDLNASYQLKFGIKDSSCNKLKHENIEISIIRGNALLIRPISSN